MKNFVVGQKWKTRCGAIALITDYNVKKYILFAHQSMVMNTHSLKLVHIL
jgi:hypothetical protein